MFAGFCGLEIALGRDGSPKSDGASIGVNGGVSGAEASMFRASERLIEGSPVDGDLEGGALRMVALVTDAVGLWSFHRADSEGHRRLSRELRLSLPYSPERRRLGDRAKGRSPSLKESSPGVHSGEATAMVAECETVRRCSQNGVSHMQSGSSGMKEW